MGFEILPHTADIRLRAWGRNHQELFGQALGGLFALIAPQPKSLARARQLPIQRVIKIKSADTAALLVDFLSEALGLSHVHREAYRQVTFAEFSSTTLTATLQGEKVEKLAKDVKAVTYHNIKISRTARGLDVNIVLDV